MADQNSLLVSEEALRSTADYIGQQNQTMDQILGSIKTIMDNLEGSWAG